MKTPKKELFAMCATKDGYDAVKKFLNDRKIPIYGGDYGKDGNYLEFPLRIGGIHEVEEVLAAHGGGYVDY